jgi:preprotein translocase subunit SecG
MKTGKFINRVVFLISTFFFIIITAIVVLNYIRDARFK